MDPSSKKSRVFYVFIDLSVDEISVSIECIYID